MQKENLQYFVTIGFNGKSSKKKYPISVGLRLNTCKEFQHPVSIGLMEKNSTRERKKHPTAVGLRLKKVHAKNFNTLSL